MIIIIVPEPAGQATLSARVWAKCKIYFAVYIILVLFVLFLLEMGIWLDLQVLEIWDFVTTLESR